MTDTTPVRIQLRRTKGWNLQAVSRAINGLPAKSVTRGKGRVHGNPYVIGTHGTREECVAKFRQQVSESLDGKWGEMALVIVQQLLRDLRGQNLACSCALDQACHADVWIDLANGGRG